MTFYYDLRPGAAQYPATNYARLLRNQSTNVAEWLAYDPSTAKDAYWELEAFAYPVSAPDITVRVVWGAATATTGVVRWSAQLAAITPETDSQDAETKTYATAVTVDDTHLGTTAKRLMAATITITGASLDSVTGSDEVWLKLTRVADHANDTLLGDAWLKSVGVSYPTT
ncbi:hypothetical protein ACIBEJ_34985 [Nonomuraea sp. NPDC050790]|uniref:hypothetical protein n=1 Tax=Nonomuraea sp. NPDC050790 TaxID=3364371 RepID=UPI0037B86DEB